MTRDTVDTSFCQEGSSSPEEDDVCNEDCLECHNSGLHIRTLAAIVEELQRFQAEDICENINEECLVEKLKTCRSCLRAKRQKIKKLKDDLKTACIIAKTVMNTKEDDEEFMNKRIKIAHDNCDELMAQNKEYCENNRKLTLENEMLHNKLESYQNIIDLGYTELQKFRNEDAVEESTIQQLKAVMIFCGQYYADYCKEHALRLQLERKNQFLKNKELVLNSHLEAAQAELKQLKFKTKIKQDEKTTSIDVQVKKSSISIDVNDNKDTVSSPTNNQKVTEDVHASFAPHLALVKSLLNDQEIMLKDLKLLSKEMCILNCAAV